MAKEFTVGVKIYKFDGTSWGLFSEPTNASRVTNVQLAIDRINNKLYLAYVAQDSYPVDEALRGKLCVCSMDL